MILLNVVTAQCITNTWTSKIRERNQIAILVFWVLPVAKDDHEAGKQVGDRFSSALAGLLVQWDSWLKQPLGQSFLLLLFMSFAIRLFFRELMNDVTEDKSWDYYCSSDHVSLAYCGKDALSLSIVKFWLNNVGEIWSNLTQHSWTGSVIWFFTFQLWRFVVPFVIFWI